MKPSKKTILYSAYIIGITLFFLWYLFPSDAFRDYLAHRLSQGNPDVTVSIDRISPILPPGLKLHAVDIAHRNMLLLELKSLRVRPRLGSLLTGTTRINFKGDLYEGTLSGRAEIGDPGADGLKIEANISGVQVQEISALQQWSVHDIAGRLGGNFIYSAGKTTPTLTGKLTMADCRLELASDIFNQDTFAFKQVDADVVLQKPNLIIKDISAAGNQLDFKLAGRIQLNKAAFAKNALNMTGTVTPHHVFWAKIEKDIPVHLFRNQKSGQMAINFKINGTLEDPGFSLN